MKLATLLVCLFISAILSAQTNDALVTACMTGNFADVKALVEKGADVNAKSSTGAFPIESGLFYVDITKYLLDKGAKINEPSFPPLVRAAAFGNPEIIKLLLDAGSDPNKPAELDLSATLRKMLEDEKAKGKKANKIIVNAYQSQLDKMGPPTKLYAIQKLIDGSNSLESLKLLVDHGAKTDVINDITKGNLIHEFAASGKSKKSRVAANQFNTPYFEKAGNVIPDWYKNPDESKMATPDEIVKYLVSKGVDINAKGGQDKTPLIDALMLTPEFIQHEVVFALVNNGSDLNVEYITIGKPFIIAAGYGWLDVIETMVAKGADINQTCRMEDAASGQKLDGMNALMYASSNNHLDVVKFLLSKNPKFTTEANGVIVFHTCISKVEGKTAIYFAIESGNLELVQALCDAHFWGGKSFTVKEHKLESKQDNGVVTITTTWCYEADRYIPSKYAKILGYKDIQNYLTQKLE